MVHCSPLLPRKKWGPINRSLEWSCENSLVVASETVNRSSQYDNEEEEEEEKEEKEEEIVYPGTSLDSLTASYYPRAASLPSFLCKEETYPFGVGSFFPFTDDNNDDDDDDDDDNDDSGKSLVFCGASPKEFKKSYKCGASKLPNVFFCHEKLQRSWNLFSILPMLWRLCRCRRRREKDVVAVVPNSVQRNRCLPVPVNTHHHTLGSSYSSNYSLLEKLNGLARKICKTRRYRNGTLSCFNSRDKKKGKEEKNKKEEENVGIGCTDHYREDGFVAETPTDNNQEDKKTGCGPSFNPAVSTINKGGIISILIDIIKLLLTHSFRFIGFSSRPHDKQQIETPSVIHPSTPNVGFLSNEFSSSTRKPFSSSRTPSMYDGRLLGNNESKIISSTSSQCSVLCYDICSSSTACSTMTHPNRNAKDSKRPSFSFINDHSKWYTSRFLKSLSFISNIFGIIWWLTLWSWSNVTTMGTGLSNQTQTNKPNSSSVKESEIPLVLSLYYSHFLDPRQKPEFSDCIHCLSFYFSLALLSLFALAPLCILHCLIPRIIPSFILILAITIMVATFVASILYAFLTMKRFAVSDLLERGIIQRFLPISVDHLLTKGRLLERLYQLVLTSRIPFYITRLLMLLVVIAEKAKYYKTNPNGSYQRRRRRHHHPTATVQNAHGVSIHPSASPPSGDDHVQFSQTSSTLGDASKLGQGNRHLDSTTDETIGSAHGFGTTLWNLLADKGGEYCSSNNDCGTQHSTHDMEAETHRILDGFDPFILQLLTVEGVLNLLPTDLRWIYDGQRIKYIQPLPAVKEDGNHFADMRSGLTSVKNHFPMFSTLNHNNYQNGAANDVPDPTQSIVGLPNGGNGEMDRGIPDQEAGSNAEMLRSLAVRVLLESCEPQDITPGSTPSHSTSVTPQVNQPYMAPVHSISAGYREVSTKTVGNNTLLASLQSTTEKGPVEPNRLLLSESGELPASSRLTVVGTVEQSPGMLDPPGLCRMKGSYQLFHCYSYYAKYYSTCYPHIFFRGFLPPGLISSTKPGICSVSPLDPLASKDLNGYSVSRSSPFENPQAPVEEYPPLIPVATEFVLARVVKNQDIQQWLWRTRRRLLFLSCIMLTYHLLRNLSRHARRLSRRLPIWTIVWIYVFYVCYKSRLNRDTFRGLLPKLLFRHSTKRLPRNI